MFSFVCGKSSLTFPTLFPFSHYRVENSSRSGKFSSFAHLIISHEQSEARKRINFHTFSSQFVVIISWRTDHETITMAELFFTSHKWWNLFVKWKNLHDNQQFANVCALVDIAILKAI